ncbi:hypothetical protein GCM10008922_48020 [Faecalicatena contorta]|uniref:DUF5688 family protein n=1 Tax=Faecalicatena contorta TaxID=39482 RepID=UPI0031E11633
MENRLSYKEFQESLRESISLELNKQGTYHCELKHIQKNNVVLSGLSIRQDGKASAPIIYLNDFYQSYLKGMPLKQIRRQLMEFYQSQEIPEFDHANFADYGRMRDKLRVRLVNKENNQAYYKMGPYRLHPMGAEVIYVEVEKNGSGKMCMQVTNAMAELWKVPKEELFKTALENTQNNDKVKFQSMNEVISEMMIGNAEEDLNSPMYVLSNKDNQYGATVSLYPNVLKQISKQIGSDYYILPSSVHELLILRKKDCDITEKELRSMVREINQSFVSSEEILGNEVFEYRADRDKVKKCGKEDRER